MHTSYVEFTLSDTNIFQDLNILLNDATPINAPTPDICGAAKLVPTPYVDSRPVSKELTPSAMIALAESPPGAEVVIEFPLLLYAASFPSLVIAATEITPTQFAGK